MTNVWRDADRLPGRRHIEAVEPLPMPITPPAGAPENAVMSSPGVQEALSGIDPVFCDLCTQVAGEVGLQFLIGQARTLWIAIVSDLVHLGWRLGPALRITVPLFSGKTLALSRSTDYPLVHLTLLRTDGSG